jgi:hypothetical protein
MEMPRYGYSGYSPSNSKSNDPSSKDITGECKKLIGEFLLAAEKRYGKCVKPIKISVVEAKCEHPEVFFDGSFTQATIKIQENVDENQRRYQLAQEVLHCLSPVPPQELTALEEGLSQVFALSLSEGVGILKTNPKYAKARELCESLAKTCGADIIRRLRDEKQRYISRLTSANVLELCPAFPPEDAELLCNPWSTFP